MEVWFGTAMVLDGQGICKGRAAHKVTVLKMGWEIASKVLKEPMCPAHTITRMISLQFHPWKSPQIMDQACVFRLTNTI